MKKLTLEVEDLILQSFETTIDGRMANGTVLGHLNDASNDELACSDACASQVYTCAACDTYVEPCDGGDGPDGQRRIIVY